MKSERRCRGLAGSLALAASIALIAARGAWAAPGCDVGALQGAAPTGVTITAAAAVVLNPTTSYCDVRGAIATASGGQNGSVLFELGLPTPWNGNFVFIGNGGFAGSLQGVESGEFAALLSFGFAAAATDTGHESQYDNSGLGGFDGGFGLINGQANQPNFAAIDDFAYRGVHLSAVASETLATAYYGSAMFSYFDGCSTGGRQALVEAEEFPTDFNGIIAGDPAIGDPIAGFAANAQTLLASPDRYLPPSAIDLLDAAVTQKCDASDGLVDGLIEDPRLCNFDPASLECKGRNATNCLTDAQVKTVKAIYQGARGRNGESLYPGFTASNPGGADGWKAWITGATTPAFDSANPWGAPPGEFVTGPYQFTFLDQFMKYFVFQDPAYDALDFSFRDIGDLNALDAIVTKDGGNGKNPDLKPFFEAGGKLLMYHGWSDPALSPFVSVNYYNAARVALHGDFERLRQDARLFMVPGMHHCTGGPGPYQFDPLTPLIQWVEAGQAPEAIIGANPNSGRTFPICAYPQLAVYSGSGDVNDATNWVCQDHITRRFTKGH